jgi:hypothetical protein
MPMWIRINNYADPDGIERMRFRFRNPLIVNGKEVCSSNEGWFDDLALSLSVNGFA